MSVNNTLKRASEMTEQEYQDECWPSAQIVEAKWEEIGRPLDIRKLYDAFPCAFKNHIRAKVKEFASQP